MQTPSILVTLYVVSLDGSLTMVLTLIRSTSKDYHGNRQWLHPNSQLKYAFETDMSSKRNNFVLLVVSSTLIEFVLIWPHDFVIQFQKSSFASVTNAKTGKGLLSVANEIHFMTKRCQTVDTEPWFYKG